MQDIQQDQKIYQQLHDMRSEFIKEEAKKGNNEARKNAPKIDMLQPIS